MGGRGLDPCGRPRRHARFLRRLRRAGAGLACGDRETVWLWGLFRHPVARRWHDPAGRVAILGDAAHPTLPFLAQGANMALEDAWVLATELAARPDDAAAALAHYQARREGRCRSIVAAADRNARAYHLRPPLAQIGHAALRLAGRIAPGLALRRFAWVHDHDATRATHG
jgi:salicylate hydroxylase